MDHVTGVPPTKENLRRFPVDRASQVNSICSYHCTVPMDNVMRFVLQFQQRVKPSYPEQNVNAIQKEARPQCFKCGANHWVRDCKTLVCRYCGQNHKNSDCVKNGQRTYCVKCKSKSHNLEGHCKYAPDNQKHRQ